MALNPSALSFTSTLNHYGKLNAAASIRNLGSFAFGAWFKVGTRATDANKHHAYVERQGTGTLIRFRFTPVQGKLQFGFSPKDGVADTSYTYNTKWDDRWHHAMFSARMGGDNPTYEIILDGVRVAGGTLVVPSEVTKVSDTAPKGIYIGNHSRLNSGESFSANTAWDGKLDDIVIFNQGQNQGEANTYFGSNDHWEVTTTDPEQTEYVAYWQFNQNSGTQVTDISRSPARTGTLYQNGTASANLWSKDRPFLGDGLEDTEPPTAPIATGHTNVNEDGFTASWQASNDNVWVQFYELQVSQFANFAAYNAYDTGRQQSHVVKGLLPATNYYWRVRALDAELNASPYSSVMSLTTPSLGDVAPPSAPTNLAASFVTYSSFRVSFVPSVSGDTVGYKIDVSPSSDFSTFVEAYRNLDIGNTTTIDIFGAEPLTSYYVRVRAYDAFDNESNDSVVLRVNTPRQPDITPPLPATLHIPTGVSSRSAILNWDEGVDDIGVMGYYVDISEEPNFASFVTTGTVNWNAVDVGNVTSYRVDGLEPDTTYYFRVRAYDEAGNIADNVPEPMSFLTDPPSVYEGGLLETAHTQTTWKSGTNVEPAILTVNGSSAAQLEFDLSGIVGTYENATLRFMPRVSDTGPETLGNVTIRAVEGPIDTPQTGASLTYEITEFGNPVEIDVTSLFTTGSGIYTVQIASAGFVGYIDTGTPVEVFNDGDVYPPMLIVNTDPMTSTSVMPFAFEVIDEERINDCVNPSFEVTSTPWATISGTTYTNTTDTTDGALALQFSGSAVNTGLQHAGSLTTMPETGPNRTHTVSMDLKSVSGQTAFEIQVEGFTAAGASTGMLGTKAVTLMTHWKRFWITFTTPSASTAVRYRPRVLYKGTAAAYTARIDNLLYEETNKPLSPFNGNTAGASWTGAANNSPSRLAVPTIRAESPFIGDSNENNSVIASFRHENDDVWIPLATPTVDRVMKTYTTTIPNSIPRYNMLNNPAFEANGAWTGGHFDTDVALAGNRSLRVEVGQDAKQQYIDVSPSTTYTFQVKTTNSAGATSRAYVEVFNASKTKLGSTYWNVEDSYSEEGWKLLVVTLTTPATAAFIGVGLTTADGNSWFEQAQLNEGQLLPYRDGTFVDAIWEGIPEFATTGFRTAADSVYHVRFSYTDSEGFFDALDSDVYDHIEPFRTPLEPDNVFTVSELALTPQDNNIAIVLNYLGDDNEDSTVRFEFKRTDLSTWSELRPTYDRGKKRVTSNITNLKHGTNYTVRAIITDPDGVYGAVNGIVSNTVTTEFLYSAADSDPHISFGGFVLMGRDDTKIGVTSHDAFGFPNRRVNVQDLPRLDGSVELQALWGRKVINMRGFISGDSRADLDDVRTALLKGLSARQQRLVIDTLAARGRFYNATVEVLDIQEVAEENVRHLVWEARFLCADPFAYDVSETSLPTFTTPNNGSIALSNDGDVETYPQFMLTTSSAFPVTFVIANETTGERIAPKATILNGDRFIIDTERRSLTKNGIEVDYAGTFPHLAAGGNILTFSLTAASGTPTVAVDIRWRHKFL